MNSEYCNLQEIKDGRIFVKYNLPHGIGTEFFKKNYNLIAISLGSLTETPPISGISPVTKLKIKSELDDDDVLNGRTSLTPKELAEVRNSIRKQKPNIKIY
jgi:hypothetical protein